MMAIPSDFFMVNVSGVKKRTQTLPISEPKFSTWKKETFA